VRATRQCFGDGRGKRIGPLKPLIKAALRSLAISIIAWPEKERRAGLSASPKRASRGDQERSGQKPLETLKVEKVSPLAGIAARKGFWLLLAHKSNKVNWKTALVIDKRPFLVLMIGKYFIINDLFYNALIGTFSYKRS
jgi:hypothetical protein